METSRRRIIVSKDGIAEHSIEQQVGFSNFSKIELSSKPLQIRPATRANRSDTPMSAHFRGADNPNWAFGPDGQPQQQPHQQQPQQKAEKQQSKDTNKLAAKLSPKVSLWFGLIYMGCI